jgi:hypothetical protein
MAQIAAKAQHMLQIMLQMAEHFSYVFLPKGQEIPTPLRVNADSVLAVPTKAAMQVDQLSPCLALPT